ncbi:hypothetical protein [[Acholeplasma] multilocale]|uniref:hypothetical protein n=1 Tax=[Acholeplasma] multilocale TaxID=264638 RepID=UPI00040E975E|nr:hypothetical protein [[Acholeplasma] multilocale]
MAKDNNEFDFFSEENVHYDKKKSRQSYKRVGLSISRETQDLEQEYTKLFKVDPPRANIYRNALKDLINKVK